MFVTGNWKRSFCFKGKTVGNTYLLLLTSSRTKYLHARETQTCAGDSDMRGEITCHTFELGAALQGDSVSDAGGGWVLASHVVPSSS